MSETRVVHVNDRIEGAVYIGRAMPPKKGRRRLSESMWANHYRIGERPWWSDHPLRRAEVVEAYRKHLAERADLFEFLPELRGKPLACWCRHDGEERTPENACHGDVLIELLERYTDDELRAMGGGS